MSRPPRVPESERSALEALRGGTLGGYGTPNARCEEILTGRYGAPVLLLSSGTHALETSAMLLGLGPQDEVLVPSFAFVTTANAFARTGARLRFVDCDRSGNLDPVDCERKLGSNSRAVVPIHYAGASGDVEALAVLAREHSLALVEDAAHAIGASFAGQPLGTFGCLGCLSFDSMKNVTAGQGGALIVNEAAHRESAHRIRDRGTDYRRFRLGEVDEYGWTGLGSNYSLSDLNAAVLWPQLERLEELQARRRQLWERYREELAAVVRELGAYTLESGPRVSPSHHIFAIVWPSRACRDAFIRHMAVRGIQAPFHYTALHRSPFGRRFVQPGERFPNSELLADGLCRLPLYDSLTESEQDEVIDGVRSFVAAAVLAVPWPARCS